MGLFNKNNVYIVGELVEVKDFRLDVHSGDKNYVAATVVIKSIVNGKELLTEARTFINELTTKGAVNKNYTVVKDIQSMLGKRVVISGGNIRGERFWSERTSQLANSTRINFNLIRLARTQETEDKATFEFGGFVTRPIQEVVDENGDVKYFQITLGQANYKEDNMFEVTFTVTKDNIKAVRVMEEKYEAGVTVEINGNCETIVTQKAVQTEVAFGEAIEKIYTNVDKKYVITGGSDIISGDGEYTEEIISRLVSAYKAEGAEIQKKASEKGNTATTASNSAKPKSKASSLAGLI